MKTKEYAVIIEKAANNYAAYCPDVPGCVATGKTVEEVQKNFQEALEFHFEGMRIDGDAIPEPTTLVGHVAVAA